MKITQLMVSDYRAYCDFLEKYGDDLFSSIGVIPIENQAALADFFDPGKQRIFAIIENGGIIASICLEFTWDSRGFKVAWIENVLVAPQTRGRGLAQKILNHCLEICRDLPYVMELRLHFSANNKHLRKLYCEKFNFSEQIGTAYARLKL